MASYVDLLSEDRVRLRKALQALIEQQEERIRELTVALAAYMQNLDQRIVRTIVYRNTFGAGQGDTLMAETETEEASKPVTEATRQLEKENVVLKAYREALEQMEAGGSIEGLGKVVVASAP